MLGEQLVGPEGEYLFGRATTVHKARLVTPTESGLPTTGEAFQGTFCRRMSGKQVEYCFQPNFPDHWRTH